MAVTGARGNRLKCTRLRFGGFRGFGWANERMQDGKGDTLLEILPRAEWSAHIDTETAIAARVALLKATEPYSQTVGKPVLGFDPYFHRNA